MDKHGTPPEIKNKFTVQGKVKVIQDSILSPQNAGLRIIVNICGVNGKFDSELSKLLTKRYARVKEAYKEWYSIQRDFKLGSINHMALNGDTWGVNLLVEDKDGKLDEVALEAAVKKLGALAVYEKASVHISDMLTNTIPSLKGLLTKYLTENSVNLYFYIEPVKQ